jgi:peptidoglycan-associated lipoprotein
MKGRKIALLTAVLLVGVVAITGCPKKEPPPPPPVEEQEVPPPPPPAPEIQSFSHDADGPRKPGDRINFKASGVIPDGGSIVVDIPQTDAKTTLSGSGGKYSGGLTLPELRPGTYQLRARIMDADGNVVATMLADAPLTVIPKETACDLAVDALDGVRAHFAFDSYKLDDAAKGAIQKVATALKDADDYDLVVAGHCDERGTIEYNLALGENRARVTREYLVSLGGVDAAAVRIVSYGEERPLDEASNETAWAKNRRAEFVLTCN